MSTSSGDESDLILTAVDVRRAAAENVLSTDDAEQLLRWAQAQRTSSRLSATAPREKAKGLNMVMVAYYFGAMLMISACAWFLGDKWDALGSRGILIT